MSIFTKTQMPKHTATGFVVDDCAGLFRSLVK